MLHRLMNNQIKEVLVVLGGRMFSIENRNGNLSKLFDIHICLLVFIRYVLLVSFNIKVSQKQVISLQGFLFLGIDSENQVNPPMKIFSYLLAL